jgi:VanZ family protein
MTGWLWRWGPAVAQMLVIFAASSIPDLHELPANVSDHTGHFIGYAILGALVLRALASARWSGVSLGAAALALAVSSGYGVSDEWHQHFVHGRSPAVDDWVADTLGAAAAVALVVIAANLRRHPERRV